MKHTFELWGERLNGRKILIKWILTIIINLSLAVQMYVSYIQVHLFILHGYITSSQYDQLSVGLIAHCIGIAEVMGSIPIQA